MSSGSLPQHARRVRERILRMVAASKSSHVGTALSAADLLVALYFKVMRIDPKRPDWPERDIGLLSKGHGCTALYATLVERGYADPKILEGFAVDGGTLWGHATWGTMPGVEAATGSLGHGLPLGLGMAIAKSSRRVFVLMGDGECDEGSVWEAALFAGHRHQENLVAIIDYNKIQSLGNTKDVLDLEPLAAKWKAMRWGVQEVDGHDPDAVAAALSKLPFESGKPSVLIAHTVKGKGVSFMEHSLDWHYKNPDEKQLAAALEELGCGSEGEEAPLPLKKRSSRRGSP
ncbi:1-deoxy-D-xylulose-5-phosphate synthase [uncultured archaeon]|nr:1-deoxy-D-xylulose-5-phosphate synthase [uncultured archaeon]